YGWRGVLSAISAFIGPPLIRDKNAIRQQLFEGDANAAIVLKTDPLLVGVYSEDLDAAVVLRIPPEAIVGPPPAPGTRLVSINFYQSGGPPEPDLLPGPGSSGAWDDFWPLIGDFLSDD